MDTKRFILTCIVAILTGALGNQALAFGDSLADIHNDIEKRYDIQHIDNHQFNEMMPNEIVVFDVRKPKEYKVSHIKNAIQVAPGIKPEDFFSQHGDKLAGKTAVFYCSVGRRSSALLAKVNDQLANYGVKNAYNLEGGVFQWHNDQIDLVRSGNPTRDIHPYNLYWGRLIDDKQSIQYDANEQ